MSPVVIGAIVGASVTLIAVFLTSYLSSRAESDKKIIETRSQLFDDMIVAIAMGATEASLDTRVRVGLPDMYQRWKSYWKNRGIRDAPPAEGDYSTEQLIRSIRIKMRRPIPGTLRRAYGSFTTVVIVVVILEGFRVTGIAYPSLVKEQRAEILYRYLKTFGFERELARGVRGMNLENLFKRD